MITPIRPWEIAPDESTFNGVMKHDHIVLQNTHKKYDPNTIWGVNEIIFYRINRVINKYIDNKIYDYYNN